jgi:hypothetical protein
MATSELKYAEYKNAICKHNPGCVICKYSTTDVIKRCSAVHVISNIYCGIFCVGIDVGDLSSRIREGDVLVLPCSVLIITGRATSPTQNYTHYLENCSIRKGTSTYINNLESKTWFYVHDLLGETASAYGALLPIYLNPYKITLTPDTKVTCRCSYSDVLTFTTETIDDKTKLICNFWTSRVTNVKWVSKIAQPKWSHLRPIIAKINNISINDFYKIPDVDAFKNSAAAPFFLMKQATTLVINRDLIDVLSGSLPVGGFTSNKSDDGGDVPSEGDAPSYDDDYEPGEDPYDPEDEDWLEEYPEYDPDSEEGWDGDITDTRPSDDDLMACCYDPAGYDDGLGDIPENPDDLDKEIGRLNSEIDANWDELKSLTDEEKNEEKEVNLWVSCGGNLSVKTLSIKKDPEDIPASDGSDDGMKPSCECYEHSVGEGCNLPINNCPSYLCDCDEDDSETITDKGIPKCLSELGKTTSIGEQSECAGLYTFNVNNYNIICTLRQFTQPLPEDLEKFCSLKDDPNLC